MPRVKIEINESNVLDLAKAMDKAVNNEAEFVEFAGEEIPIQVVGEALMHIASSIIARQIVSSIVTANGPTENETVH